MTKPADDYRAEIEEPLLQRIAADVQLLRQARDALVRAVRKLCSLCDLEVPHGSTGHSHLLPRGGWAECKSVNERAALTAIEERLLAE